jgi:hypothetical protein
MSSVFSPKTPPWPEGSERAREREGGNVTLMVFFLLFIFAGIGLGMVCFSQAHLKLNASRKFSLFLDYASENGLKRGLADLGDWLQAAGPAVPFDEGRLEDFRDDPAAAFPRLLEEALGAGFPRVLSESDDGLSWECLTTCGLRSFEDRGDFVRITAGLTMESRGAWQTLRPRRVSRLDGSLGMLAGRLPLPSIPFLINRDMTGAEQSRFPLENGVTFLSRDGDILAPRTAAAGKDVLPGDATALAARALDIRLFTPQDLSPARLRYALGLEPSEEPVPDGVYLVRSDIGLGGIFVQGETEELVLAIDGDAQVVTFRMEAGEWTLRFSPSRSRTEFLTPAGDFFYDLLPLGIIIVNGGIRSLGGGTVEGDGIVRMVRDRELPCILDGVSLTIVSSDRITLSSHLILQGARWQEGIPYVKESQSQVVIFSTGRDLLSRAELEGGIAVDAAAPDGLKLQASLTAGGKGFEIGGRGKAVEVLGALHAAGYEGNGNALRLAVDERFAAGGNGGNVPLTAVPRLAVYSLKILSWRERE